MSDETAGDTPEESIPAADPGEPLRRPAEAAPASPPPPVPPAVAEPPPQPALPPPAPPSDQPARVSPPAPTAAPRPPDRGRVRPELTELREPLFRDAGGYTLRMDPPDLVRLRELPGSRDKTDRELGEKFFDAQAARLVESIAGDVPIPAEVRVVVDPYSRQAFLAVGRTIRGIISF
jgi:flagellar protein FliO/FliZ